MNSRLPSLAFGLVTFLGACSGGGDGGPAAATSPTSSVPVSVTKQAGDAQSGVVGAIIAAPVVKVLNFSGAGVAGVTVTFTASSGDVLGATTVTTGADGTASAGSWKLSTVAGVHSVSASAAGVSLPASFTATVAADVARTMTKSAGDNQSGFAGANATTRPAVVVSDQYGNPVTGVSVTFTGSTGGGSVSGSPATTNANGVAAVTAWRFGPAPGANTLVASAAGLTSVTFAANTTVDPCETIIPAVVGQPINGTLSATDCLADEYFADLYSFRLGAEQTVLMEMESSVFNPWIDLYHLTNDEYYALGSNPTGSRIARIRLLAQPGEFLAAANSVDERSTGAYAFRLSTWNGDISNCATDAWVVPSGVPVPQTIASTDCPPPNSAGGNQYYDIVRFIADAGRTYTITMQSSVIDPTLTLRAFVGQNVVTVANDDNSGGGTTARIVWTPTSDNVGFIYMVASAEGSTGAYTFTVSRSGGASISEPTILRPARGRGARPPASAGADALSAFRPGRAQTTVRDARRP